MTLSNEFININEDDKQGHQQGGSFAVLGVPVSVTSLAHASNTIISWAHDKIGRLVCIRDVHGVMRALDDPKLMKAHHRAALVTPDGAPLALIGRWKGYNVKRTCGSDLMERIFQLTVAGKVKHYFFGGQEGVAEDLKARLEDRFHGCSIVGTYCPPFRPLTDQEIAAIRADIIESGADIVWVGLSTPKQELWMLENVDELPATLIGVGAAFDFLTQRQYRAPLWMQALMLEWFYRFLKEPRRLWYRYLVLVPKFMIFIALDAIGLAPKRNGERGPE